MQHDLDYRLGWLVVRAAVFLLWSYPLQKSYVYRPEPAAVPDAQLPKLLVLRDARRAPE
jgi:hypothetical protein